VIWIDEKEMVARIAKKLVEGGWMNDTFRTLRNLGNRLGVSKILITNVDEMKMIGNEGREMSFELNHNNVLSWTAWANGKKLSSGVENIEGGTNVWTNLLREIKTMLALKTASLDEVNEEK
jgi:hypothetical protein